MATKAKRPTRKQTGTGKKRIRKIFGDIHEVVQMPNLIEVQRESYEQFLRSNKAEDYVSGLEKTLRSVFPIRDFAGTAELDFVHYELEPPKYDTTECRQRGITYAAPMKVTLRLIVFEVDQETETLDRFYNDVARRAEGIDNAEGKQKIITELYERFFAKALPKTAEALGIVYTPLPVVDFIVGAAGEEVTLVIERDGEEIAISMTRGTPVWELWRTELDAG